MKLFIYSLILFTYLFSGTFLDEKTEDILDIQENIVEINSQENKEIFNDKLSYEEFVKMRWEKNIELGESWGTEIAYKFYMLDISNDIDGLIKNMESNKNHLTDDNILEIREEIELKYGENVINKEEKDMLEHTINLIEVYSKQNDLSGGDGDGSGGDGSGGDGGGGGDGD